MKVGVALVDVMTGLHASIAVLAALQHRHSTGEGQYIDLALLDVQVACMANQAANYLVGGQTPRRMGNAHPNIVPYQDFPTADGHMILTVGNDAQFAKFSQVAGHPEWAADERFATNPARVAHRNELLARIRAATVQRSTAEWISALEAAGVPCGPINTLAEVFADPQVVARELVVDVPQSGAGSVPVVANPIRLSASPVRYHRGPPQLGEHTGEVIADWLGQHAVV
jgi:crotonobetainyl-CoA:carnitine CoA-transferase CaiB-like acyl-CoA transferase